MSRRPTLESLLKWRTAPISALSTLACVSTFTPASAHRYEYYRQDVLSCMLQCSFDRLEQCKWTSSGRGGDCLHAPFLPATDALLFAKKPLNAKTRAGPPVDRE
jgi:hypothetical protein